MPRLLAPVQHPITASSLYLCTNFFLNLIFDPTTRIDCFGEPLGARVGQIARHSCSQALWYIVLFLTVLKNVRFVF